MVHDWYDATLYMICFHTLWHNHVCTVVETALLSLSPQCSGSDRPVALKPVLITYVSNHGVHVLNWPYMPQFSAFSNAVYCHVWLNYIHNKWGLCTIYISKEKKKILLKQISDVLMKHDFPLL